MFYSQFILAKKGPLGTIWIAAHLERKLRKNQVADTDIGVSVDSILFPEVPIALRLSSHLLLGVVRIYSRKVNYLFDDCSEALLKIKQAFRSTAVDLPPEESTAPYHSITLPETFDLDDFELPESELFQGTYVDHHVSSREQITLQDNMDNVAYPSSQFGLDERFGDGDTSQIGLDLEEEMLLVKASAPGQGGVIKTALQEFDETVVKEEPSNLEAMQEDGNGDQVNDLDEASELADYAQAPATPCLVEVSNLSNVKERLILDDHMESEDQHLTAVAAAECGEDISQKLDHHPGDKSSEDQSLSNKLNHDSLACMPCENGLDDGTLKDQTMSLVSSSPNTISAEYKSVDGNKVEDGVVVGTDCKNRLNGEGVESPSCSNVTFDMEDPSRTNVLTSEKCMENENGGVPLKPVSENDVKTANNDDESYIPSKETTVNAACQLESPSRATVVDDETQACLDANYQGLYKSSTHEEVSSVGTHTIKPCNTCFNQQNNVSHEGCDSSVLQNMRSDAADQLSLDHLRGENEYNAFEASTEGQGEGCQSQMSERDFCEKAQVACGNSDERPDNVISGDNQMENSNNYGASELPAPEKLLCVPETLLDGPNDLLVETTPDKEVPAGDDEIGTISKAVSGKKRSYTESTLTMESINSVESFGGNRSKRTAECIPDDDDLLSSILVGRRSSVLKMKTTPAFEVASKKRVRSVTRTSAMKRKVLLDDMMVLHGDAIRQQLTNTEDIRRVRKKAPCTRPEISMIQRQFLEHEIFSEPIFSGMSVELASLYSGTHDLSRIGISECKDNHPPEGSNNVECSVEQKVTEGNGIGHSNDAQRQLDGIVQIETQCLDHDINTQEHISSAPGGPHTLEGENLDINELHIDERSAEAADAANMFGLDEMMNLTNPVTTAYNNIFDGETQIVDASQSSDALCISPDQYMKIEAVKESAVILSNGDGTNHAEALDHIVDDTVVGLESIARGDNLYEESGGRLADVPTAHQEYSISISNKCGFPPTSVEGNPGLDEEKQNVPNEDMVVAASSELNDQGPSFNGGEEPKPVSGDPEHNVCNENASTNVENQMWGTNAVHVGIDAHDHLVEENRGEFEDVAVANDTDFLNLDDDEVDEDDDDDEMPSTEDRQLLENSGWSSRTRAVARYLQNLFDSENVHGRKVLSTDGLLTGKTRKEAARMFFETLVLKTKDYIQVEQPKAFGDINIKPRATLMKSIF